MTDLRSVIEARVNQLTKAEEREGELKEQVSNLSQLNDATLNEIDSLTRKIVMQKTEFARIGKRHTDLLQKLEKAQKERDIHAKTTEQVVSQENVVEEIQSELSELQSIIREKESRLNESMMRMQRIKNDLAVLTPKLIASKTKAENSRTTLEELRSQTDSHTAVHDDEDDINSVRELEAQIRELDVQNDDLKRQINLKNTRKTTLEKTYQDIEREINKLKQEMQSATADILT
ncbi:hypothetical protein RF11_00857 [Thelohanellus kitauei]|uniref:Uncharacterized protein n=1 Tax=Thelohanellus kitauei TaxID=669202 RepID=A0A0C2ML35_THEKT|nr:hypothetical protein RF11_00857 [Thelohanellus kitauei]